MELPISVIIPTYNRPESLSRTLSYLSMSDGLPSQIIVVDQTQDLYKSVRVQKVVESYTDRFPQFTFLKLTEPSSTHARNVGIAQAVNDILVFADDDIDVASYTMSRLIYHFSDTNISMVGACVLGEKPGYSVFHYLMGIISFPKRKQGHVSAGMYGRFPIKATSLTATEWAMGYFFAVRKSLLDRWDIRFDEKLRYYAYAEDLDFTYNYFLHVKQEGYRCILDPNLDVKHNVSNEFRLPSSQLTMVTVLHRYYVGAKYRSCWLNDLAIAWSDFGMFFYRLMKHENPRDWARAMFFLCKHRQSVRQGDFNYPLFVTYP